MENDHEATKWKMIPNEYYSKISDEMSLIKNTETTTMAILERLIPKSKQTLLDRLDQLSLEWDTKLMLKNGGSDKHQEVFSMVAKIAREKIEKGELKYSDQIALYLKSNLEE